MFAATSSPDTGSIPLTGAVRWQTSSFCGSGGCIEVGRVGDSYLVRDSKVDGGPHLTFTRAEWDAFVAGVRASEFDY